MGEREQEPKIPPINNEVNFDAGGLFERVRASAKKKLTEAADRLWEMVVSEGPEYLEPTHEDYIYSVERIRQLLGNPDTDEEFERRLEELVTQIEQNPNAEDFEKRIAAIAYGQGQSERLQLSHESLHKNGVFERKDRRPEIAELRATRPVIRAENGKILLRLTAQQAGRLRATDESRARIAMERVLNESFDEIIAHMDDEPTGEVA